jgi:hypothetical protein
MWETQNSLSEIFFRKALIQSSNTFHHCTNIRMALGDVLSQFDPVCPNFYNIHFNIILLHKTGYPIITLSGFSTKITYDLPVSLNVLCVFPISVFWSNNPNITKWRSPFCNFLVVDRRYTDMFGKLMMVRQKFSIINSDLVHLPIFGYKNTFVNVFRFFLR